MSLNLVIFCTYIKAVDTPIKKNILVLPKKVDIKLIKLKTFTPPRTILVTGKVETIEKETLKFQGFGKIKSILEVGSNIDGQIYNSDGKIIEPGTLIAQQYIDMDKSALETAKTTLETSKLKLDKAKIDYYRNKKLLKDHAVSHNQYEIAEVAYLKAKSDLKEAYQGLKKAEFLLMSDYMYSSYNAIVKEIYQSPNVWYEGFQNTVAIEMMDPVAIKIPIAYLSDVNHLSEKPIIYSPNSNMIIENWICEYTELNNDKYYHYFIVPNKKISFYNNLPKEYDNIPKIGWITKLIKFNNQSSNLAVPTDAVHINNEEEYVWSLTEHDTIDSKNVVNYKTYIANKIQVETNNRIKRVGIYKVIELKNSSHLKLFDNILWDLPPKGLKDGEMVLLDPKKWKLAPGDTIKVLVKLLPMKTGFYVPLDSITLNEKRETFVTLKNGKHIKVKVEGSFADFKLISSKELKEGTVIKQNPNDIHTIMKEYYNEILVK
ncbi:MAG TPA: hypothetical protein QF753_16120 [Victivallales bacterium]|nr:hypothetical protein [Victivallales bacterium]